MTVTAKRASLHDCVAHLISESLPAALAAKMTNWEFDLREAGACLLDASTLRHALEEEFDIEISDREELAMMNMTAGGLVNMMAAKLGVVR